MIRILTKLKWIRFTLTIFMWFSFALILFMGGSSISEEWIYYYFLKKVKTKVDKGFGPVSIGEARNFFEGI